MVKLDNWETKAERARERRIATKQLKNQKATSRRNKAMAQELLSFLDDAVAKTKKNMHGKDGNTVVQLESNRKDEIETFVECDDDGDDDGGGGGGGGENADVNVTPTRKSSNCLPRFQIVLGPSPSSPETDSTQYDEGAQFLSVHIWTDFSPSIDFVCGSSSSTDQQQLSNSNDSNNARRRPRSQSDATISTLSSYSSLAFETSPKTRKSVKKLSLSSNAGRSNDKKQRPRSNTIACDGNDYHSNKECQRTYLPSSTICTEFSFCGSCSHTKKGRPISFCSRGWHLPVDETLFGVMSGSGSESLSTRQQETLQSSKLFAEKTFHNNPSSSKISSSNNFQTMANIYHHHLKIRCHTRQHCLDAKNGNMDGATDHDRLSDAIVNHLKARNLTLGGIIYVVMNNDLLLFDRHKGGIVLSDTEKPNMMLFQSHQSQEDKPLGSSDYLGSKSLDSSGTERQEQVGEFMLNIPTSLLEHVLLFLPESSISPILRVCKNWNLRIGKTTPNLWRSLGIRRGWILNKFPPSSEPHIVPSSANCDVVNSYKEQFMDHYAVVRVVDATYRGVQALSSRQSQIPASSKQSNTFAILPWKNQESLDIIFMKQWSSTRIVMATRSCHFMVYDAVTSKDPGAPFRFKQVVDQTVGESLTRGSGLSGRSLVTADSDSEVFGCVFLGREHECLRFWFQCIQRDALLCTGVGGVGVLDDDAVSSFSLADMIEEHCHKNQLLWDTEGLYEFDGIYNISECRACGEGYFLFGALCGFGLRDGEQPPAELRGHTSRVDGDLIVSSLFILDAKVGAIKWFGGPTSISEAVNSDFDGYLRLYDEWISGEPSRDSRLIVSFPGHGRLHSYTISSHGDVHKSTSWLDLMPLSPRTSVVATSHGPIIIRYVFEDKSQDLSNPPMSPINTTILSLRLAGSETKELKFDGILQCGRGYSTEDQQKTVAVRKDHLIMYERQRNDRGQAVVVIHVPTMSVIHQIQEGTSDFHLEFSTPLSPDLNDMLIHIRGKGLVLGAPSLRWSVEGAQPDHDNHASFKTTNVDQNNCNGSGTKKKKSSKRRSNSGKDGYARGMRATKG